MEFLLSDDNYPFSVALMLMLIIALTEGVLTVLGAGMSQALDSVLPDVDFDLDADISSGGVLTSFLGWIRFGQVPALVLLVIFLATFGLSGLMIQSFIESVTGHTIPALIATPLAVFLSLPMLRTCNGVLGKVVFKDETESISSSTFIGRVATITIGEARQGSPAEARFKDRHDTTHYVMVEPVEDVVFTKGQKVLLVESSGAVFKVIDPVNPNLRGSSS